MINTSRRTTLKLFSAVTGVAAMTSVPVVAAGVLHQPAIANEKLQSSLELEFVDSKSIDGFVALGQVTVTNRFGQELVLTDFAPAIVTTANANYDLAAHLKLQPVTVFAGQRLRFWVRPMTTTDQYGFARLVPVPESGGQKVTEQLAGQLPRSPMLAKLDLTIYSPGRGVDAIRQSVNVKLEIPGQEIV